MQNVSVARRYARALLEAAGPASDKVLEQLTAFARLMEQSAELKEVLTNPAYSRSERQKVVDFIVSSGGELEGAMHNLLKLLVDRNRMAALPDIARVYRDMADQRAGRLRGKLTSAVPLPDEVVGRVERSLEKVTQRDVVLERAVDPKVLGGVAAQVGSFLYDGTVRTQLEQLRRELGG